MFRRDPVEALKKHIRELEEQVPELNEALALLKAQVNLAEADLAKGRARERELVEKVAGAVGQDRHDVALNYAATLADVRREVEQQAGLHEAAAAAFARAQRHEREFMAEKEQRIQEAKDALAARRAAEWNEQVAKALHLLTRARRRSAAAQGELVETLRAREPESQALLARALEDAGDAPDLEPRALRVVLEALKRQLTDLDARLGWTRRQVEALERRLGAAG